MPCFHSYSLLRKVGSNATVPSTSELWPSRGFLHLATPLAAAGRGARTLVLASRGRSRIFPPSIASSKAAPRSRADFFCLPAITPRRTRRQDCGGGGSVGACGARKIGDRARMAPASMMESPVSEPDISLLHGRLESCHRCASALPRDI